MAWCLILQPTRIPSYEYSSSYKRVYPKTNKSHGHKTIVSRSPSLPSFAKQTKNSYYLKFCFLGKSFFSTVLEWNYKKGQCFCVSALIRGIRGPVGMGWRRRRIMAGVGMLGMWASCPSHCLCLKNLLSLVPNTPFSSANGICWAWYFMAQ